VKQDAAHNEKPYLLDEIVFLTQALIRFKTMHSKMDEMATCAAFIEGYLSRHQIAFTHTEHDGYPSILALPDKGNPVFNRYGTGAFCRKLMSV
jgi:acetylornithine deacetylase/succinyl-diaminopimelate desuccinylase-like protein